MKVINKTSALQSTQNNKDIFNTKGAVVVFYRMCYKYWTPNGVRQMAGWNNRCI